MGIKVVKRDGILVDFDSNKIVEAILKAGRDVGEDEEALKQISGYISRKIEKTAEQKRKTIKIEEIQNLVVKILKDTGFDNISKAYQEYRERRTAVREVNSDLLKSVGGIIDGSNDDVLKENANKSATNVSCHRDLVAGEVSRKIAEQMIPKEIWEAHKQGVIKVNDADYIMSPLTNCSLLNVKDMLDNGCVMNNRQVDSPNSFRTACTLMTQQLLTGSSSQFGGITFSVSHLAPYVRKSKNNLIKRYSKLNLNISKEDFDKLVEAELTKEIDEGCDTISWQINTFISTNGQALFCSAFLYVNEDKEYREETAKIIEVMLKKRIEGMKNKFGVLATPIFPKLLFVLDEDNIYAGTKYFYLTELATKCVSLRMSPDFISAKKMREYYGDVFPCMGKRKL